MKKNKTKIIYILSLSHSGSTLLDTILSKHKEVMGLGEVFAVFADKKRTLENTENICSCGNSLKKCIFWSQYKNINNLSDKGKYNKLLTNLKNEDKKIFIDSSKTLFHLKTLLKLYEDDLIDLKVLFLVRDPRGWVSSIKRLRDRVFSEKTYLNKMNFRSKLRLKRRLGFEYFNLFYKWRKDNKRNLNFLLENKADFLKVNYKEFCFNTENVLIDIFKFMGVASNKFSLYNIPNSHIAYGNRMKKNQNQKDINISYDDRWFDNFWLNFNFLFFWILFKDWKDLL